MPKHRKKYRYSGVRPAKQPDTYIIDYRDHNSKRHQVSFRGTEANAVRYRRNLLAKADRVRAGLETPPEKKALVLTLDELWSLFKADRQLKVRAGSMSERTLDRCANTYNNLIDYKPRLKSKRIDIIDSDEFEGFKIHRKEKDFAPEGINVDLSKLKAMFNFAVKKGYLKISPLAEVSRVNVPQSDIRFLNDDELTALNDALESLDLSDEYQRDAHDLTLFYLYTGARTSEALYPTFTWEHDLQNSIRFPRTKRSKSRTIPKVDMVKAILESRKHIEGGPFHFDRDKVYKRVKSVMKKAGLPDASTHTLRKTAGAWYYMATRDIFAASKFLGHSSVMVTEQHYAGLIQSLQVKYARQFEDALNSKLLISCYFNVKQDQSGPITPKKEETLLSS